MVYKAKSLGTTAQPTAIPKVLSRNFHPQLFQNNLRQANFKN